MNDPRPLVPVNPEGLEKIAQSLLDEKPATTTKPRARPSRATKVEKPENYIILEGQTHGSYSYPDLLVATSLSHKDKDWDATQAALHGKDSFMLTPRQYVDFLNLLRSGKAFYGSGKQIDSKTLERLYDEITEVRDPWRAEHLDAKFSKGGIPVINTKWGITYHKINQDGTLTPVTEPLQDVLMSDKKPGISIDDWLKNATDQGLPSPKVSDGQLWYWHPRDGAVAGFDANSGGAGLGCYGNPQYSNSALGVRPCRVKI